MSKSVSDLISEVFDQAILQNQKLYKSWVEITFLLGGKALPYSLLGCSVHDIGAFDLVLRCMENDTKAAITNSRELPDAHWYQDTLSRIWISEIYEVFRLLKNRELVQENNTFNELANHLRLLRIPFDKQEIAKDKKLKEHPKLIQEHALLRGKSILSEFDNLSKYDSKDPKRVYSLYSRNTPRGSIEWKALDLDNGEALWLERLSLSERVLELFQNNKLVLNL